MTDIMTPALGESVTEATVARWAKKPGDKVAKDEVLVELETDKVNLEVGAPEDGVLTDIVAQEGATIGPGTVLGHIGAAGAAPAAAPAKAREVEVAAAASAPAAAAAVAERAPPAPDTARPLAPSVQRIVAENSLDPTTIAGSGKDGRITKGDALAALEARAQQPAPAPIAERPPAPAPVQAPAPPRPPQEREERVRMTRLRQTIARRLKEAQETAAMLTTFNEVDMGAVMAMRSQYKDVFEKRHGVRLGFMSFFVKACVAALKEVPNVNAEIDGTDLIYKNHYDIGVAVGTERGLVVPVVRDADALTWPESRRQSPSWAPRRATARSPSTTCRVAPSPSPTAGSTAR